MQKIVPFLWFDTQAGEAADFYTRTFKNSKIKSKNTLKNTPSGDVETYAIDLMGTEIQMMSAGPYFKINPSISFMVNFDPSKDADAAKNIDVIWEALSKDGQILMPLQEYPFSKRYGWIQDRFGVSWQLILTDPEGEERPNIIPSLLFVKDVCGKAEEAINFYTSVFENSKKGMIARYGASQEPNKEGTVMFADFQLFEMWFAAMDSAQDHKFSFNEAVSFLVNCETQEEIDTYWEKLSADPASEQCGWLKDKFGVSWQITPYALEKMLADSDEQKVARVTEAFLKMKKMDIAELEKAANG